MRVGPIIIVRKCAGLGWRERTRDVRKRGNAEGFLASVGLTCVRVIFGYFWLSRVLAFPPPSFGCPDAGFCLALTQAIHNPLSAVYRTILEVVVQQHAVLFAWISTALEAVAGVTILLGVLTRLGALVGLIWSLAFLICLAAVPGESAWYYLSLVLLSLVFLGIGGSNQLSVDHLARWRTWWGAAW